MRYERLTRKVYTEIGGEEYGFCLTLGMFEELEDMLPKGSTIVNMFVNGEAPTIKLLRKTLCLSVTKNGGRVKNADEVFEQFCFESGIQEVTSLFYAVIAASYLLGAKASNDMLEGMGFKVKDDEEEEAVTEKNT